MNNYINTLKECSKIANKEHEEIRNKLNKLNKDLTSSQNMLIETRLKLDTSDINNKSIYDSLNKINNDTSELLKTKFKSFEDSFSKKANNLSDFTVTLFGRTKAGKSTIREALTNGDGSTIGKGSQRTTRDAKIYHWNHLRILDTPGFDAYNGEEDENIAFSQVDETDLILFLITSDSIEESEFEKLATLRRENKSVIILLNVLYDLTHPLKRKQFLNDPKKYVSLKAVEGHLSRLKFLSKKHFDIQNISVIPIHALSAFESNQSNSDEKNKLYDASNFRYFSEFIAKEIETTGKQKRVQSFRDSYIFHLENSIKSVYEDSYKKLNPIVKLLRNKQFELRNWFDKFIPNKNDEIEREIDNLFLPLFNRIDYFVDQNVENLNFSEEWNGIVNNHINKNKITIIQENIMSEMNRYLAEFFKEFKFDLNLSISNIESDIIQGAKKGSTGKILKRSVAITGALSAVALANAWNPLGWGLGAVSFGLGLFSWWRGDNDTKHFNNEKADIKMRMSNNLEQMQRKNKGALKTWFYKDITQGLKKKITNDLYNQVDMFQKLLNEYKLITTNIDSLLEKENIELIQRLLELQDSNDIENNIYNIARVQGVLTKILIKDTLFNDRNTSRDFMKIYGERIIEVKKSDDKIKFLLDALNVETSEVVNAFYNNREKKFIVKVNKMFAGKIYGSSWSNLKTAEKIMKDKIQVEVV